MAKVLKAPNNIPTPVIDWEDLDGYHEKQKEYMENMSSWAKGRTSYKYAGEKIKFPVADGHAEYVVCGKGVLLHLEVGDCWEIPDAHIRGLRSSDIEEIN